MGWRVGVLFWSSLAVFFVEFRSSSALRFCSWNIEFPNHNTQPPWSGVLLSLASGNLRLLSTAFPILFTTTGERCGTNEGSVCAQRTKSLVPGISREYNYVRLLATVSPSDFSGFCVDHQTSLSAAWARRVTKAVRVLGGSARLIRACHAQGNEIRDFEPDLLKPTLFTSTYPHAKQQTLQEATHRLHQKMAILSRFKCRITRRKKLQVTWVSDISRNLADRINTTDKGRCLRETSKYMRYAFHHSPSRCAVRRASSPLLLRQ